MAYLSSMIPGGDDAANTGVQPTAAEIAEDAEWDAALEEFAPGVSKLKKEDTQDEQADTTTTTTTIAPSEEEKPVTTTTTTTLDPNETADQKAEREKLELAAADKKKSDDGEGEEGASEGLRTARQTQREIAAQTEAAAANIRERMFTVEENGKKFLQDTNGSTRAKYLLVDGKPTLADGDGDIINSIQDVMKLINPLTVGTEETPNGRGFTEDEAASWLLAAQQKLNQNVAEMDKHIDQIANVTLDLKDQSDSIKYQYGELLQKMPDLRDQLWNEYEKTLVVDPKTGIIIGMPVALESFYEIALTPYIKLAESLEAQAEAEKVREAEATKVVKRVNRSDRSDIFGRGNVEELSDDDKEWSYAAKEYYGNQR